MKPKSYETFALPPHFSFLYREASLKGALSEALLKEVEHVWSQELGRRKTLYNGSVLSLVEYHPTYLVAEMVEYKMFLAYLRKPHLRKALGIQPLGLSGMVFAKDKVLQEMVLIGRRSKKVTQYPFWYECVPSGGIDERAIVDGRIDIVKQALDELYEETGYSSKAVKSAIPFALIFDPATGIYEICVNIMMQEGTDLTLKPTEEYDHLQWVSKNDLPSFVKQHRTLPLSVKLLAL